MLFILAQICGAIVLVLTVVSVQFKTKEKILIFQIIANVIVAVQYFLLNALTGGVVAIINTIRCVIFYLYKKKDKKPSVVFLIIFICVAIISGILTWQDGFSIIPIIAAITFTYGLWQDNVFVTKICTIITSGSWIVYNIIVKAYVGAVQSLAECVSAIIATIRYRKDDKKEIENEKVLTQIENDDIDNTNKEKK